jgi:hypothetical protein
MKTLFNSKLNLLALMKSSYVEVSKMIPLTNKIGTILFKPLSYNIMLAYGRIGRLAGGIRRTNMFIKFVVSMYGEHGASFTIKWLKSAHVAICKTLGQNKLISLRQMDPDLPLPRLVNGLPKIIPVEDRMRIRRGNVPTIRFWLGLFNLYRVLQAPGKLKLETITAPFTGDVWLLRGYCRMAQNWNPFSRFAKIAKISKGDLTVDRFHLSRSASPSNKVSMYGVLSDVHFLETYSPGLWQNIKTYLQQTRSEKMLFDLDYLSELNSRFKQFNSVPLTGTKSGLELKQLSHVMCKEAIRAHGVPAGNAVAQFAIKEEAAGKIRVFALVDSITQTVLAPLHDSLFRLLRAIPTDGTFDQEASLERGMEKAVRNGKAFSFDLTAATDRIPVLLTTYILAGLYGDLSLAKLWRRIISLRPFSFNEKVADKLRVSPDLDGKGYRYRVGQPMGALSSWAGLAITHHWIVQLASYSVHRNQDWFMEYELLGDDLVIFDEQVAQEYLKIMAALGCEINMTKSIVSPKRPVFEFAKRVCWGFAIVSGISLGQVRSGWKVSGRVANAISFARAGLLENSRSLLLAVLSRNAFSNGKALPALKTSSVKSQKSFSLGVLALLGERFQNGIISLRELMHATLDPFGPIEPNKDAIAIPIQAALKLAYSALVDPKRPIPYPFSHEWKREPKFLELEDKVATAMLHASLNKVKELLDNFDSLLAQGAQRMYFGLHYNVSDPRVTTDGVGGPKWDMVPYSDLPGPYLALITEVESFYSYMLGFEMSRLHPSFLYKELYSLMDSMLLYDEALELADQVDALSQKLEIVAEVKDKPNKRVVESAKILGSLRDILGVSRRRRLWHSGFMPKAADSLGLGPVSGSSSK